jgi:hypothetical protein
MPDEQQTDDTAAVSDPDQLRNLLLVLEHAHADAWLRRDRRALEALLAPEFVGINTFGRYSRDKLLIRLFPHVTIQTFTIEAPALLVAGRGAAALTYQGYQELTHDGRRMKGTFHVSALYSRDKKLWKLALWQITPFCDR